MSSVAVSSPGMAAAAALFRRWLRNLLPSASRAGTFRDEADAPTAAAEAASASASVRTGSWSRRKCCS
jgi:hypothetical protein